jgi:heat-inducible transcriptional repressor
VPSQLGYRFYVDQLIEHYAMTNNEIAQINRILKSKTAELDQILLAASKLASAMTNYTGLAVKPGRSSAVITRFETAYIDEYNFVLIMINASGNVISKHIRMAAPKPQQVIAKLASVLNENVVHLTADALNMSVMIKLEEEMGADAELVAPIVKTIYTALTENDGGELQLTGIGNLLHYRDYESPEQLGDLLGTLEQKDEILKLVSEKQNDDISVLIGSESSVKVMNNSAIVFKPIVRDGKTLGVIGVLGPLRMDYAKVLETIERLCGSVGEIMDEYSALAPPGNKAQTTKEIDIKDDNDE